MEMKKILFTVILSVLTLLSYSQDGILLRRDNYKENQLVQSEKLKGEYIQIEEESNYVIVDDVFFYFIDKLSDSVCYYCLSSYIARSGNVYYYFYIFDDQIIISRTDEDCEDFVVYYFHKFKPSLIY